MIIKNWHDKREEKQVGYLRLRENKSEHGGFLLEIVDENGIPFKQADILLINQRLGVTIFKNLSNELGFPLDEMRRIKINKA